MPNNLDPKRFTLRQAPQARDDFAQVMDELDFVKELIAPHPGPPGSSVCPPAHNVRVGGPECRARYPLVRGLLAALPVTAAGLRWSRLGRAADPVRA